MKIFRHGQLNKEKPGILLEDKRYDLSDLGEDFNELFFETGGLDRVANYVNLHRASLPEIPEGTRLGSAVARPSKIVCIGLNYAKHAAESGTTIPAEPVLFFKSTTALSGPDDDVIIPRNSVKTDWEVELALVILKRAAYVLESDASSYIAGYVLHNDYSEREFQIERSGQWVKGKSSDTFAPLGPYLVTPDEVRDPQNLQLWLKVNGEMQQNSNTNDMVFKIPFLIHYVSQFMTLLPGDIISTGTPFGVGLGLNPPVYLNAGDVVELGIEGLGESQ